jgi:hypothetical protein
MQDATQHQTPEDFRQQIPAWLTGGLDERALRAFEERLAGDAALRNEVEELQALWDTLPDRAPEGAPIDFWPLIRDQLPAGRVIAFPERRSGWQIAVSFAAGIIVGLGLWLLATGGPAVSTAAEEELLAHDTIFESLDPLPLDSVGGIYLAALPLDEESR